ncbi:MAG: protease HtpX [Cyanobium sp.]
MRLLLFLFTNLLMVLSISLVVGLLTALGLLPPDLPLLPLAIACFLWGMVGAWLSLQFSAESARRVMGVQLLDPDARGDWLVATVAALAQRSGLPMPQVGVYDSPEWNAFATGPSPQRALVAVSSGILAGMPEAELEAVLAHELSHVANGDMVTMTLLQGVVNAFVLFLARAIVILLPRSSKDGERQAPPPQALIWPLELLLGIAGSLLTAWFSRHREFRADAGAAQLTAPAAMAGALARLEQASGLVDRRDSGSLNAFKIAAPDGWRLLFASHPPIAARIRALQVLDPGGAATAWLR